MYHCQECCESVQVEDCEDVSSDDLKESIIHTFEEYTKSSGESGWGLQTYTFYRLITNSAYIRWFESQMDIGVGVRVVLEVKGGKDKVLSDGYGIILSNWRYFLPLPFYIHLLHLGAIKYTYLYLNIYTDML